MENEVMQETNAVNGNNSVKLQRRERACSAPWFKWIYIGQACYNYERMQGTGFYHSMLPIIERLYPNKEGRAARHAAPHELLQYRKQPGRRCSRHRGLCGEAEGQWGTPSTGLSTP